MKVLVIDIETTGLDSVEDSIVEIAAVLLNTRTGKIKEKFNFKILDDRFNVKARDAWIFKNSSLDYDIVFREGIEIERIRRVLQKLIKKFICTAYNQVFDFGFLRERGFVFNRVSFDPMILLTGHLKIKFSNGSYKWPKVQEVIEFFGWEIREPHRALGDAKIEAKIIYEIYKRGWN